MTSIPSPPVPILEAGSPSFVRSSKTRNLPTVDDLAAVTLKKVHDNRTERTLAKLIADIGNKKTWSIHGKEKAWRDIQLRCETHPEEAMTLDRRGRSCLHALCAKRPPLSVVNVFLKVLETSQVIESDNHGRTPLSIAISSNASIVVVKRLLFEAPEASKVPDVCGLLPLHLACSGYDGGDVELAEALLHIFTPACWRESHNGRTPLHLAIESGTSVELVRFLSLSYPDAVVSNNCGMNALFMAIRHKAPTEVVKALIEACPRATSSKDRGGASPLQRAVESKANWGVVAVLCRSDPSSALQNDRIGDTPLHSYLRYGLPSEGMVRVLVRECPAVTSVKNRLGLTPLELACNNLVSKSYRDPRHEAQLWAVIKIILRGARYGKLKENDPILPAALQFGVPLLVVKRSISEYPEQVSQADPITGESALVLALQMATKSWGEKDEIIAALLEAFPPAATGTTVEGRSMLAMAASHNNSSNVLQSLISAAPQSLACIDPVHNLLPFQIAAASKGNEQSLPRDHDAGLVCSIFTLVQAAPSLIDPSRVSS